jgi:hypothetical protein
MNFQPFTFKHLDIDNMKTIAGRWAADYTENGALVNTISIHPVLLPIPWAEVLPGQKGPKYAVVFHCPDCTRDDLPSANDSEEDFLQKVMENDFSPYTNLWCDLTNKSKHLFYRGLFESVYRDIPPDNWISEWRFILKYSGAMFPLDVMADSGVVLFPAPIPMPKSQTEETPKAQIVPTSPDRKKWSFTLNGPVWDVTFDGEAGPVTDRTPARRMLPALEQPGVKFGYIHLIQMTTKSGEETQTAPPNGLSIQTGSEDILTRRDLETWQAAVNLQRKRYKENPEAERDRWNQFKATIESSGYHLIETEDSVKIKESKWKADVDRKHKNAGDAVSKNRTEFLKMIQHLPKLHDHMERFLKLENGLIYNPPNGSPLWEIDK